MPASPRDREGLTKIFGRFCPCWRVVGLVTMLVIADVINLGADLNATGNAKAHVLGGPGVG